MEEKRKETIELVEDFLLAFVIVVALILPVSFFSFKDCHPATLRGTASLGGRGRKESRKG